jgi:radical SAM-linked protein
MKLIFAFSKGEDARWLGHLDLLRTFERAVRRSGLPVAFTNGFNPRERLAFANALPVGVTGAEEIASIEMSDEVVAEDVVTRMNKMLPPCLQLVWANAIPDVGFRDLLNSYDRGCYEMVCECPEEVSTESLTDVIQELLASDSLTIQRTKEGRTKSVEVRPFIVDMEFISREGNRAIIRSTTKLGNDGSVRPVEVIGLIGVRIPGVALRRAHRVRLESSKEASSQEELLGV